MPKKQITIEVESAGYDLVSHSAKLVAAVKASGGFSASAIPAEVAALVAELPAIVQAAKDAGADLKESEIEFIHGANEGAYELLAAIKG